MRRETDPKGGGIDAFLPRPCSSLVALAVIPARAQTGFDRPGGDYARFTVPSGDPAVCSARCDRDARCRAWTFSYPGTAALGGSNVATAG